MVFTQAVKPPAATRVIKANVHLIWSSECFFFFFLDWKPQLEPDWSASNWLFQWWAGKSYTSTPSQSRLTLLDTFTTQTHRRRTRFWAYRTATGREERINMFTSRKKKNSNIFNFLLWHFQSSLETVLTQTNPQLLFLAAGYNLYHTRLNTLQYVMAATCCCCLKFPRRQFLISPQRSHHSDLQLSSLFSRCMHLLFLLL